MNSSAKLLKYFRRFKECAARTDTERAKVTATKFRDTILVLDFVRSHNGWVESAAINEHFFTEASGPVRRKKTYRILLRLEAAGFIDYERSQGMHAGKSRAK